MTTNRTDTSEKGTAKRSRRRLYQQPVEETVGNSEQKKDSKKKPEVFFAEIYAADETGPARNVEAKEMLNIYVTLAMGASVLPVPLLDAAAVTAVQIGLIKKLSEIYRVPFSKDMAVASISSLVCGAGAVSLAHRLTRKGARVLLIGPIVSFFSYPILSGMTTYALGKVFLYHYELGGTLLNFDPEKTRQYFMDQFQRSGVIISEM